MDSFIFLLLSTLVIHAAYGIGILRRTKKITRMQMQHYDHRLHVMAHNLYTPLGSIRNFTELLSSERVLKDKNRIAEYTDIIDDNVVRTLETLRYYIDISRIENDTFELFVRDYSLPIIVEERLHFYGSRALKSSVALKMDIGKNLPEKTAFDSRAVSHMIDRLLSCMIERSIAGNTLTVQVFYIPNGETLGSAAITSGIKCSPPEKLTALPREQDTIAVVLTLSRVVFEEKEMITMFEDALEDLQFVDSKELTAQTLLRMHHVGLMVVKRWAEAHGGTAGAFNCKEGSTVYFTLKQARTGSGEIRPWA